MTTYGMGKTVNLPFSETVTRVKEELSKVGFGIVSEVDMKTTLKNKIDKDIPDQLILGACNPNYAFEALGVEPSIGLLLPCNVVVRSVDGGTRVEVIDPHMMIEVTSNEKMKPMADEVREKLDSALNSLAAVG